jgi:membrane associated rhomboid family serine protease
MLLPYGDSLTKGYAFAGVLLILAALIALDVPAFLIPPFESWCVANLGFIPALFSISPWHHMHTLLTSEFVHGDIFHLLGNALFFWVFGRSLERLFGFLIFLVAFPFLGLIGLLAQWAIYPTSTGPVIGASGAIAVLMGAYLTLFPSARMRMVLFIGIAFKRFRVPAWVFLFYWGGLQFISLLLGSGPGDNVAYAVHVGGFAAGVIAAMIWKVSFPFADERLQQFIQAASITAPVELIVPR